MLSPSARLRASTREIHDRLEQLGYSRAVLDGSLPSAHYASFLRALFVLHNALEQCVELAADPALRAVFGRGFERRALLEQDLAFLRVDPHGVDPAALCALVLAQRMRLDGLRDPHTLLGHMYVLEGSQLGGLVQHKALSGRPELRQGGLAYLAGAGRDSAAEFQQFSARLDLALSDPTALERATLGALACFEGFEALLNALEPSEREPQWLVSVLNGEAGTHAIPADLREVEAALRAGEQTWRSFAYYQLRYRERGLRYTRSDSAWLATLAREDPTQAARHIAWLARVLSARGMPRLLLELHLGELQRALSSSVPERSVHYESLELAATALREERLGAIAENRVTALIAGFEELAPPEEGGLSAREAATLLVAAVADEQCGVPQAVPSLTRWLADPSRFSTSWVSAVQRTLRAAQKAR